MRIPSLLEPSLLASIVWILLLFSLQAREIWQLIAIGVLQKEFHLLQQKFRVAVIDATEEGSSNATEALLLEYGAHVPSKMLVGIVAHIDTQCRRPCYLFDKQRCHVFPSLLRVGFILEELDKYPAEILKVRSRHLLLVSTITKAVCKAKSTF
jgi:hypothetical protein